MPPPKHVALYGGPHTSLDDLISAANASKYVTAQHAYSQRVCTPAVAAMASAPTTWTDDDTPRDLGPRIVALHAGAALVGEDEFKVCNWVLWAAHESSIDVTVIERSDILFRDGVKPVAPPAALKERV